MTAICDCSGIRKSSQPGTSSSGSIACTSSPSSSPRPASTLSDGGLQRAEEWMLERFEGPDGLAAIFPAMLNSLIALKALGYPDDHPQVVRAEQHLKGS